jgi:hypothetical protein
MKFFALLVDGRVAEVFSEYALVGDGDQALNVPLEERYHPDFIATLVPYDRGSPPAEPARPAPTVEQVAATRDSLLATATLRIAPLQDAVDLDDASDDERAHLKAWKQYRVALSRVDTASAQWPTPPADVAG